ncbi:hypothetical protein RhiJN_00118 [Ceratobasidium sp. AG-Ba]|nr:hypothetical protein RhiJN_00118 [Ceratobasidium sp. AG-Ba]
MSSVKAIELSSDLCDTSVFDWLQRLPSLIALKIVNFSLREYLPVCSVCDPFPALSELRITSFATRTFASIWQPYIVSRLVKLVLEFTSSVYGQEISGMLRLIAALCPKLCTLIISFCRYPKLNHSHAIPLEIIRSLPITKLIIIGQHHCDYTLPENLRSAYTYWPNLEILHLGALKLECSELANLSTNLPHLVDLSIGLVGDSVFAGTYLPLPKSWPDHSLYFTLVDGFEEEYDQESYENLGV